MSNSFSNGFSGIREKFNNMTPTEFLLPLMALLVVGGAFLIGTGGDGGSSTRPDQTPKESTMREPLSIDKFIPVIPKTFKVELEYDTFAKKLNLKDVAVLSEEVVIDNRLALFSPYEIAFYDTGSNQIYRSRATISESVIIEREPGDPGIVPAKISSTLYIPYSYSANRLIVYRAGREVINISIPDQSTSAEAENARIAQAPSCGGMKVVFISDGYGGNYTKFVNDVELARNAILNTPPYESLTASFEFHNFENDQDLGCASSGILSCVTSSAGVDGAIARAATQIPGAGSFIIMSNGGGTSAAYFNRYSVINSSNAANIPFLARHEFLGHALGNLYDRYITNSILEGDIKSNCTDNPGGESWWGGAGGTGAYSGCTSNSFYAPFANTCSAGGNPGTVMALCGGQSFDSVESAWLTNYKIPSIRSCAGGPPPSTPSTPNNPSSPGGTNPPTPTQAVCNGANEISCGGTCFSVSNNCAAGWTCGSNGQPQCGQSQNPVPADYSATISWNAMPTAAGGYQIVFVSGTTNTGIRQVSGTSYTFTGLAQGSYSWTVWALDTSGNRTGENVGAGQLVGY